MFIEASAVVPLPPARAREVLTAALATGDLAHARDVAGDDLVVSVDSVGPRGVSKRVRIVASPARRIGEVMVIAISWKATGGGAAMFPTLNATLAVLPVNAVTSLLSIAGRYDVPLGRVGETLDHSALAVIAQRTVDSFLRDLAKRSCEVAAAQPAATRHVHNH